MDGNSIQVGRAHATIVEVTADTTASNVPQRSVVGTIGHRPVDVGTHAVLNAMVRRACIIPFFHQAVGLRRARNRRAGQLIVARVRLVGSDTGLYFFIEEGTFKFG